MNIDLFIEVRKQQGLSQIELAKGICTQATLSRFENNGQVPSLKIVVELCKKLNLSISELFPKVEIQYSEEIEKMNQAEFFLITSEYVQARILLETIRTYKMEEPLLLLRYYYLQGFIMIFKGASITEILFNFDQILLESEGPDSEIFRLLAYTGIGMVHEREGDNKKAEFYFSKVLEKIYKYPIKETEDTWRVLNIVYQSGEFYSNTDELEVGNALLEYAVEICSHNHVTYYLARAAFQLALNALKENKEEKVILEQIYDARSFAKINKNTILLKKLATLESQYLNNKTIKDATNTVKE